MKIAGVILLVLSLTIAIAAGKDPQHSKPGMSLRLELFVTDMCKSVDFYTNVLGFEKLKGDSSYVPVQSGSVVIGLGTVESLPKQHYFNPEVQKGRRGLGTEIVLEVDDVQACFDKVKARAPDKILSPPRKRSWGATDFRVADPDGYYLRITSRE